MNKNTIIYLILSAVIIMFAFINQEYKLENVNLENELKDMDEVVSIKTKEIESISKELDKNSERLNKLFNEHDSVYEEKLILDDEIKFLINENEFLKSRNNYYVDSYSMINELINNQVDIIRSKNINDLLSIEVVNANNYNQYTHYYIPYVNGLMENLRLIAKNLSLYNFSKLPINVVSVDNIDGKVIALVNLEERPGSEASFIRNYFQGSTGGYITMVTLVESFLQREANIEEWIDGVMFSYKGRREMMGDHIEGLFEKTYYRNIDYFNYED